MGRSGSSTIEKFVGIVIELRDRSGPEPAVAGIESTSNVWSAVTSTLIGKLRARCTNDRAGSKRRGRTPSWRALSSATSLVNSEVTSITALESPGLQAAMSKLLTIGGVLDRSTARLTGSVESARIAKLTIRSSTCVPIRSHRTTRAAICSPA